MSNSNGPEPIAGAKESVLETTKTGEGPAGQVLARLRNLEREPNLAHLKEIIPHTSSTSQPVKEFAIQVATQTIKAALFESYHDMDASVRKGLVNLLVKINPDIVFSMRQEIYSADIFKRVRAIQILGLVGNKRYVEQYLVQMIRDSDEKVRATVIRTLGELINKSEANILITLLNDMDERVRANTIEALEKLGNRNLVGILSRYRNDPNNRIRANALKALWALGFKEIRPSLEEMVASPLENMRASAAWLIGEIGKNDPTFLDYIKRIKYSDSALVKNNVIRALLKMDPSFSEIFLTSLFDQSEIRDVKDLYRMK